jgi:membrane fusion protein
VTAFFREEVILHSRRRLDGAIILATPLSLKLLSWSAVAVLVLIGVFLSVASFARRETVTGWLAPDAGLVRVSALQGGAVEAVVVTEGQTVKAGQPIVRMRLTSSTPEGDDVGVALSHSLLDQQSAADTKARTAVELLEEETRQLTERLGGLDRELSETRHRIVLQTQRITLAKAEVERAKTIAERGFLSQRELDARRSDALGTEQDLAALNASALSQQREQREVRSRLRAIPIDIQAARAEALSASAGLRGQSAQTQSQSSYLVVSPVAGRVAALPVTRGQTLPGGGVVSVIMPSGSAMEAELYAPSRAAGFVRPGQEVRLKYDAFPYQKFGTGEGRVVSVSRTVLAPNEVAAPGLDIREPVFRVRVALRRDTVSAYGQDIPLQPGGRLSADIIFDRRTLMEWLLDPIYAVGRRT